MIRSFSRPLLNKYWQVRAIYMKDFTQIVFSPMFSIICLVCCILWGFNYVQLFITFADMSLTSPMMMGGREPEIHRDVFIPLMSQMNLVLIFIVPALTMRLFAEEKKSNTFDLLMSAPLTALQIVFGKFIAAYTCTLLLILLSFIYIVFSGFFGDFNWTMPIVSYLGISLVAIIYVALGLLASIVTRSVVLSVILGVIFNLFLWFFSQAKELSDNVIYTNVMSFLSVNEHLTYFASGQIVLSSLWFYFAVATFCLYLTKQILETSRWR